MGDFITNESSFLAGGKRGCVGGFCGQPAPASGPAPLVGTRRRAVMGEPAVALSRRRSRSVAKGRLLWCAFAHGRLRKAVPPPGLAAWLSRSAARRRRRCPAAALSEGTRQALDQTTRPLCPRTVAAARCSSARPARRVPPRTTLATPGGFFESKYRPADAPSPSIPSSG